MAALVLRPSRSIDQSINLSGAIIAPYALTTKSDLQLISLVTYSDKDISIFRGYYCTYQLAGRPVRHGIILQKVREMHQPNKYITKQIHKLAKHFG